MITKRSSGTIQDRLIFTYFLASAASPSCLTNSPLAFISTSSLTTTTGIVPILKSERFSVNWLILKPTFSCSLPPMAFHFYGTNHRYIQRNRFCYTVHGQIASYAVYFLPSTFLNDVLLKVRVGNFAASKKSGLFRWLSRRSLSVLMLAHIGRKFKNGIR
jgi:hypothetical protein